jgi:hypothetical protein
MDTPRHAGRGGECEDVGERKGDSMCAIDGAYSNSIQVNKSLLVEVKWISTDSVKSKQWCTYLGCPHHLPSTTDILPTNRTHRVTENDSK